MPAQSWQNNTFHPQAALLHFFFIVYSHILCYWIMSPSSSEPSSPSVRDTIKPLSGPSTISTKYPELNGPSLYHTKPLPRWSSPIRRKESSPMLEKDLPPIPDEPLTPGLDKDLPPVPGKAKWWEDFFAEYLSGRDAQRKSRARKNSPRRSRIPVPVEMNHERTKTCVRVNEKSSKPKAKERIESTDSVVDLAAVLQIRKLKKAVEDATHSGRVRESFPLSMR
jgi:hypothetical protein